MPSSTRLAAAGFAALALAMGIGRFAYTPLLPMMIAEGRLAVADGGILASAHFAGYAVGAFAASRVKGTAVSILFFSLAAIGLSTLTMGLTDQFAAWLIARAIAGICSAFVLIVVGSALIRPLSQSGHADLQGWVFAGVGGGIAFAGVVCLFAMWAMIPSDQAWSGFGILVLLATLVFAGMSARRFPQSEMPAGPAEGNPVLAWNLFIPYGVMGAGYIIPATYLPVMAREQISSPIVFGWGWPIFGTAAAISTVLAIRASRRFSNRAIWTVSQLLMAAGMLIPALFPSLTSIIISALCVGGTFMVITMSGLKEANRLAGKADPRTLVAAITAAFAVGQIIGPLLAGWAYDASGSFSAPLLIVSLLLTISLVPVYMGKAAQARKVRTWTR